LEPSAARLNGEVKPMSDFLFDGLLILKGASQKANVPTRGGPSAGYIHPEEDEVSCIATFFGSDL
ncbi:MAG: hypothetical protein R6V46_11420, partial [Desulfatiglandaceae bacterium]